MTPVIRRMTAFPAPDELSAGIPLADRGNPAGVVLDAGSLDDADMLRIAADLGYSETAFVTGGGAGRYSVATSRPRSRFRSAVTRRSRRPSPSPKRAVPAASCSTRPSVRSS